MKRVLMIAFHFPPGVGSSGVQRTLSFVRYLPDFGWEPIVLTVHPRAHERTSVEQLADLPKSVRVVTAQAWDTARHLSVSGRYPRFLAVPDRWASWKHAGTLSGLRAIKKFNPNAIWSTYPIPTAHVIASRLAASSRSPWVADFRDPMVQERYPKEPVLRRAFTRIESGAIELSKAATFTTPGTREEYGKRFPLLAWKFNVLENGYDEEIFRQACATESAPVPLNSGKLTLLHSGIVYPNERDPTELFKALRSIREEHPELSSRLMVRFRAPVHTELLQSLARQFGAENQVEISPPLDYSMALREMLAADALLVLQASNCNQQIPAKLYEYVRTGRPILALTDASGDTAQVLQGTGVDTVADLSSATQIRDILVRFLRKPNEMPLPNQNIVRRMSRLERTSELAAILDRVCSE